MKRWQLWSSVVGGLLSVGAPGTYYSWQFLSNRDSTAAQTVPDEGKGSVAAKQPTPVPTSLGDEPPQPGLVSQAGFVGDSGVARQDEIGQFPGDRQPPETFSKPGRGSDAQIQSPFTVSDDGSVPQKPRSSAFADTAPPFDDQNNDNAAIARSGEASRVDSNPSSSPDSPSFDSPPPLPNSAPSSNRLREIEPTGPESALPVPPGNLSINDSSELTADSPETNSGPNEISNTPPGPPSTLSRSNSFGAPPAKPGLLSGSQDARPNSRRSSAPSGNDAFDRQSLSAPASRGPTPPTDEALTSNAPGERKLEGSQSPSLSLEKSAPEEIQVGKPTKFMIRVRNIGNVAAHGVVVTDQVPLGTQFMGSVPETRPGPDGRLAWELGTLQSAEETSITVELMPQSEGEIGSVAQVSFAAQMAVRTLATRPLLTIEHSGPARVLIGEKAPFTITVSNPGSGVASGVVVEVDVPNALNHEGGREIMSDRFDLRPNETRKLDLVLTAAQAGMVESVVRAVGDAGLEAEHQTQLEIIAPQLQLGVNGPSRRYLDRQVTYQVAVTNPGTAPANDIELMAYLPQGLKFVGTDQKGRYDASKHAVYWSLEELPAGESGAVQLSAVPIDTGEQKLHIEGRAALNLTADHDHTTLVEALTELVFTVADENDPIEVGADTSYEIRITNNGSKNATRVQLAAMLPRELVPVKADGPTKVTIEGQQVVAEPIAQLSPGEEVVYRLAVKGQKAGDHLVRVQVVSDEFSTPVTKEESTKVYADE